MKYFLPGFVFLFCCSLLFAQTNDYLKDYLSVDNGLTQNEVTSIAKDKYGFMWFGTRGGLNRYDGYEFKHYKPDVDTARNILNPSVERIFCTKNGNIWIGTKSGGFSIYDIKHERFTHSVSISDYIPDRIISFFEDKNGTVWIGSWQNGVVSYAPETGEIKHYLDNNRISAITQTPDGFMWFGSNEGLICLDNNGNMQINSLGRKYNEITAIATDTTNQYLWLVGWTIDLIRFDYTDVTLKRYEMPNDNDNAINTYSILQSEDNDLWIGTWGNGLYRFSPDNEQFEWVEIKQQNINNAAFDYQVILDLYQDNAGYIWIGTDGGGIVRLSSERQFNTINFEVTGKNWHINTLLVDNDNVLWIGTKGDGIHYCADHTHFEKITFLPSSPLYGKKIITAKKINETPDGTLWVNLNISLYVIDKKNSNKPVLQLASTYFDSPELQQIRKGLDLIRTGKELWIATQQDGLYIFGYNKGKYALKHHFTSSSERGLENNRITTLTKDRRGNIWLGSYSGMYLFSKEDSTFKPLKELVADQTPVCNIVLSALCDSENNIWFGTPCGLNRIAITKNKQYKLNTYNKKDGLPDDYINGILNDNNGNIWLSTNAGISQLNPKTKRVRNFEINDGIGGYNFSEGAYFKTPEGIMYFGGYSHLTYFEPEKIKHKHTKPEIAFTSFKVMNEVVEVDKNGFLPVSINKIETLTLTHRETEFSFEFAALDYKSPQLNQYAYKLEREGDEQKWNFIGNRRHISFRNLPAGNYVLHIRGSNSNGIWNEKERTIQIKVLPPPWKTWYAFAGYIIIIMLIIILINRVAVKQEKLQNLAKLEHLEREKEKQLNEYKLRFFTNISHEFRTPLTLILAPLIELKSKDLTKISSAYLLKQISYIYNNANKLLILVNQLLEFRKAEAGKIKLKASEGDFQLFMSDLCMPFESLAKNKGIRFNTSCHISAPKLFFDPAKLRIVINNLLSNAFKFCGLPGEISVTLSETASTVTIEISNNGKGMTTDETTHIFDRFYQISKKHNYGSSGIGLSLVKTYIELHKGTIEVESTPDVLTTFRVNLKKGKAHLKEDDIVDYQINTPVVEEVVAIGDELIPRTTNTGTKGATILIVEDNPDVQEYVAGMFADEYNIYKADNGKEGYEKAIEHKPDLIIGDVMMPVWDGFEMCQKIKSNDLIAHIPLILLTAKNTPKDILFGTRKGADAYITKPFDPELLSEKVRQLLASHKIVASKFSKKVTLEPKQLEITPEDEKLLKKAMKIVEKKIDSPGFNINVLAAEMAMSISTLNRKMKTLLQQTPGEFIKSVRMKRAVQLLEESDLTITEIAEMVGYQDIKSFRKAFTEQHNLSPGEYRKTNVNF